MRKLAILLSAFAVLIAGAGTAAADTRSVYTISDIPVDKTANTTREAEAQAFAEAKIVGLRRLINKLTLPEDRGRLGEDFYSFANANELATAVDVDDERRSTTVYRANLSVVYNPIRLRAQLQQRGVPFVDQQSVLSLLAPVSDDALAVSDWREAWPAANNDALNPYVSGLSAYTSGSDWSAVRNEVFAVRASNAIIAELLGGEGGYSVRLTRLTASGTTAIGTTARVPTLEDAVLAATAYLDATWKQQSVIRGDETQTDSFATVRYTNLAAWNRLRSAISNSPLISGFQVKAIARDGAIVSFRHAGSEERLVSELSQRGVIVSSSPSGWILQLAGAGRS